MRERPCSDCLCLILLFAFIGLLSYTVSYSVDNNNVKLFLSGVDVDGNICGYSSGFEDFGAVYYIAVPTS